MSSHLNDKQKKALKGTCHELLKVAAETARIVREDRDAASESKRTGPPQTKRQRRDTERYDTHKHTHNTMLNITATHTTSAPQKPGNRNDGVEDHHRTQANKEAITKTRPFHNTRPKPKKRHRFRVYVVVRM